MLAWLRSGPTRSSDQGTKSMKEVAVAPCSLLRGSPRLRQNGKYGNYDFDLLQKFCVTVINSFVFIHDVSDEIVGKFCRLRENYEHDEKGKKKKITCLNLKCIILL